MWIRCNARLRIILKKLKWQKAASTFFMQVRRYHQKRNKLLEMDCSGIPITNRHRYYLMFGIKSWHFYIYILNL